MNSEIKLFRALLQERKDFFESNSYIFEEEKIYNEGDREEFFRVTFKNKVLYKEIFFDFYTSFGKYTKNEITASITKEGQSAIGIATFLAYKNLNQTIRYEDREKYRLKVDPQNLEEAINQQLDRIIEILSTDMKELFTTEAWMRIPIHDPRDDY